MISYSIYKIVHLTGIFMVFLALGGILIGSLNSGNTKFTWRKPLSITHGLGLVLSLVGGFGLLARLGVVHGGLPGWAIGKLIIWVLFAASIALIPRRPTWSKFMWPLLIILGGVAAFLAGYKPT